MSTLATLTELTDLARQHGWIPLAGYAASNQDWQWLNLTRGGTHLDIEWEPGLPTGCQIHASHMTGPRIIVNARSRTLIEQAITTPGWVDAAALATDSAIDLREVA